MGSLSPLLYLQLGGLDHPAGFDAVGANHQFLDVAIGDGSNPLQIWVETTFCKIVGMTDIISHHRLYTANFAFLRHA